MPTRVCAISFKECWKGADGSWYSNGGFPLQMAAVASLFDHMTLLITRSDTPGAGGLRLPAGSEIVELRKPVGKDFRRKLSILAHLPYYLRAIGRHVARADHVHVPPPGDIPLLGMLVAIAMRKRLIVRYCGSWVKTGRTTVMNRVTRALMRVFAGGRNVMLATGEAEGPPAPGVSWIFATGVSERELRQIDPVTDRAVSDPPRIAYVGRLSSEKGVGNLIEAVALLEREGFRPLPRITLIGDGPDRGALAARVQALGWNDGRVCFAGQLDRVALSAALPQADFCVQPSLSEGYSKAWLDAFAHGLPVLASEAGAARVVIGADGERGWLVAPGDVRQLADRLRQVVAGAQDWRGLRRRCRQFAESRTLEAWAGEIGQLCCRQWNVRMANGKLVT
jgi:glycosyltransferase involved in cell wall biosynthesis